MPPVSSAAWTRLRVETLKGGPVSASTVTAWSGGYLALGQSDGASPLPVWISRDGRSWVALPAGTLGPASLDLAAPCGDGVVVAIESETGETTVWHSTDGVRWTSTAWPQTGLARRSSLAGSALGALAILDMTPPRLAFSTDGSTWQPVPLPGSPAARALTVSVSAGGFVALGDAGTDASGTTKGSPVAWWSTDGTHWALADVQADPGAGFDSAFAGRTGLAAFSHSVGYVPGLTSYWTSADGRSWKLSTADPYGVLGEGEGMGSAAGSFEGDEMRILGNGSRIPDQRIEYWVSFDGTHWTRLALDVDRAAPVTEEVAPFLMRDGVLFSGATGSWFGTASTR